MTIRTLENGYELDDDPARIDIAAAFAYLAGESYWAKGRERSAMDDLVREATRVVGLYDSTGAMVGFARAIADRHTFAYLADVYVLDEHRGHGLGVELVREMVEGSEFPHVRWMLGTKDAHGLYRKLGFGAPTERIMERQRQWTDPG